MSSALKKVPSAKSAAVKTIPVAALGLDDIKALIALVASENVHEFEFETGAVRFRIRKDGAQSLAAHSAAAQPLTQNPVSPAAPLAPATPPAPVEDPNLYYVTSPIVGTFYRSPSPTAPQFVQPGDFIRRLLRKNFSPAEVTVRDALPGRELALYLPGPIGRAF